MRGRINRQETNNRLLLPRVGFVKTGYKSESGFPTSVDYFLPCGKYKSLFDKAYGEKPNTIQIVFPDDEPNNVCLERYEYRDKDGKLFAFGDGQMFDVWNGSKYVSMDISKHPNLMKSVSEKSPNKHVNNGNYGWTVTLTLSFIIPKISGIAGYWQFITKGHLSTIPQIRNLFDNILESRGFVKGILFDLTVQFAKSQKPGVKSRYPVVSLIPNETEENLNRVKNQNKLDG